MKFLKLLLLMLFITSTSTLIGCSDDSSVSSDIDSTEKESSSNSDDSNDNSSDENSGSTSGENYYETLSNDDLVFLEDDDELYEITDPTPDLTETGEPNWLHVEGSALLDSKGTKVRLTGVNWFGFETQNKITHGLWARDYKDVLQDVIDLGFNTLRIPWANVIIGEEEPIEVNDYEMNAELVGKTAVEALVIICEEAQKKGLKVILDNHSRINDGYMEEDLWYTDDCPHEKWIEDWKYITEIFKDNDAVIAMDLNNEPHDRATWGTGDEDTDWAMAAEECGNEILKINPNVLIMVEGVEGVNGEGSTNSYWWGGNLQGVKDRPIELSHPDKLVYSPHEYGPTVFLQPWFESSSFPGNMPPIWDKQFGYIEEEKMSHLFVGELGIRDAEGKDEVWFSTFLKYMALSAESYSWTFWALNPNSGDTGGLYEHDWSTIVQWKVDYLKPFQAPMIGNNNG